MAKSAGAVAKSPRTSLGPSPVPMNSSITQGNGEGERTDYKGPTDRY